MSSQILHFVKQPGYLRIAKDRVVRLKYLVFHGESDAVIEFRDDLYYLHGGYGGAFAKVEAALEGEQVGAKVELQLTAEEAYGPRDPAMVITGPADHFPPEAQQLGARLEGHAPDGHVVDFVVTRINDGRITVDGNHPLAGMPLRLVLEVLEVRAARTEELKARHAFAPPTDETPTPPRH
ncbi:MAG TPA: peptidylprolyl isomerase [Gammaproteobacteria bacterium]